MEMKKYKVTCLNCSGSNIVSIMDNGNVKSSQRYMIDLNEDHKVNPDYIISGRYRSDMNFGWECKCGNDSRIARQEVSDIERLVVNGGRSVIEKIVEGLKVNDEKKFRMVEL